MESCAICHDDYIPWKLQNTHRCCAGRWCIDCDGKLPKYGQCPYCRQRYGEVDEHKDGDILYSNAQFRIYGKYEGTVGLSWYHDGALHRDGDRPANICYYENGKMESERWYRDGLSHRDGDRPAEIRYYKNGKIKIYDIQ